MAMNSMTGPSSSEDEARQLRLRREKLYDALKKANVNGNSHGTAAASIYARCVNLLWRLHITWMQAWSMRPVISCAELRMPV